MRENSSKRLLVQFKAGNKHAANELFDKYFDRAVSAARSRIKNRPIASVGSEDVVLSAFESLWRKADNQGFDELDLQDSNEFWKLLCTVIRFKAEKHIRRANAAKRGGGKELRECEFANADLSSGKVNPLANHPDDHAIDDSLVDFHEQYCHLMKLLDSEFLFEIVTLKMEGMTTAAIADRFGRSNKWVQRKLSLIREIWRRELDSTNDN